ncbi:hypothetical protein AC1031_000018 [Aphanomyces cochlioides]|nr:hypothetical protein AC1031_000018 [Aphanomyces cochlioides]
MTVEPRSLIVKLMDHPTQIAMYLTSHSARLLLTRLIYTTYVSLVPLPILVQSPWLKSRIFGSCEVQTSGPSILFVRHRYPRDRHTAFLKNVGNATRDPHAVLGAIPTGELEKYVKEYEGNMADA